MNPPHIFAERKLQLKRNSFFCTIPKGIIKYLRLKKGDVLKFYIDRVEREIRIVQIHKEGDEQHG